MPNFWTKNIQKLDEHRKGPRTRDLEFAERVKESQVIEKALFKLKWVCSNFVQNFEKIMEFNRDLTECIFLIYNKNEQFKHFSESLTKIHLENNEIFKSILEDVDTLSKMTKEWPNYFKKIKILIKEREEARINYDHYEKKLHAMEDKYFDREIKGCLLRHKKFVETLERNEKKYKIAKKEYLNKAIQAYNSIEYLLDNRFSIVNPVLLKLYSMESKIYESFYHQYDACKNLENELVNMKKVFENYEEGKRGRYDPTKFMKFGNLDKVRKIKSQDKLSFGYLHYPLLPKRFVSELSRRPDYITLEEFDKIPNIFSNKNENGSSTENNKNIYINNDNINNYNENKNIYINNDNINKYNENKNIYINNDNINNYNQIIKENAKLPYYDNYNQIININLPVYYNQII